MSSPRERWRAVDTVMAGLIGLLQNYITITRHAAWVRLAIGPALWSLPLTSTCN